LLSFDKSASRMIVSVPSLPTPAFIELQENAKAWLHENAPELEQEGSSTALMFTHIGIRGMLGSVKGALIALVLIAIVLLTTLRSVPARYAKSCCAVSLAIRVVITVWSRSNKFA